MEFSGDTPVAVWKKASTHLLGSHGEDFGVILQFPAPAAIDETDLSRVCPRAVLGKSFDRARDVANTIFPRRMYERAESRDALYTRYLAAREHAPRQGWGTYFERLVAFGPGGPNQLERVVGALSSWKVTPRAALVLHLSGPALDKPRTIGAPCLQYVQLNCPSRTRVDLLAVYRNHDYCNKVLGNLFGLARLLAFVAAETSRTMGSVTCLSSHAYFETSNKNQRRLVDAA
jgi:hypothetical protein